jgi:hypothetical protein
MVKNKTPPVLNDSNATILVKNVEQIKHCLDQHVRKGRSEVVLRRKNIGLKRMEMQL